MEGAAQGGQLAWKARATARLTVRFGLPPLFHDGQSATLAISVFSTFVRRVRTRSANDSQAPIRPSGDAAVFDVHESVSRTLQTRDVSVMHNRPAFMRHLGPDFVSRLSSQTSNLESPPRFFAHGFRFSPPRCGRQPGFDLRVGMGFLSDDGLSRTLVRV